MFINRRKDKEDIYYIWWSISHKKNKIRSLVEIWMDLDSVTEWSKSETLKQILYINTYMWSVENDVCGGFPSDSDGKETACNVRDSGSIPGSGRFPGEGNGNSLQYFCLENPMGRGAWWVTVHGDTHNWVTNTHTHTHTHSCIAGGFFTIGPTRKARNTIDYLIWKREMRDIHREWMCGYQEGKAAGINQVYLVAWKSLWS